MALDTPLCPNLGPLGYVLFPEKVTGHDRHPPPQPEGTQSVLRDTQLERTQPVLRGPNLRGHSLSKVDTTLDLLRGSQRPPDLGYIACP